MENCQKSSNPVLPDKFRDISSVKTTFGVTFRLICITPLPGTDVWLYAVEPASEELLWYNSTLLEAKMTGRAAQTNLKYVITGDLHVQVRHPPDIRSKKEGKKERKKERSFIFSTQR
jgi:hypothetical protein